MIKKFFAKLMNFTEQKEDFAKSSFRVGQNDQAKMARERNEQSVSGHDGRKYVSERAVPTEGEILSPSESKKS